MTLLGPEMTAADALQRLQGELDRIKAGQDQEIPRRARFSDFAVLLAERKVALGELRSAKSREKWAGTIENHLLPPFGALFLDSLRRADIEQWKARMAARVRAGSLSPNTVNGWLAILRVIVNAAVAELELERNPVMGVRPLDTATHHTYTEESPNALTVEEVPAFLAEMTRAYPQFAGIVTLGFATGLRPSSLRPLRRRGPSADVLWDEGVLLVRRSHVRRDEVMETTKTKRHQRLALPEALMDVLRWHVDRLPASRATDSDLLFPSRTGGFHAPSALDKPFREVAKKIGLTKTVTPRAMRRTFQDLARAAQVKDIVTRAVSGHATESMQHHYSTVQPDEMRAGLAQIISLAGVRSARASQAGNPDLSGAQGGVPHLKDEEPSDVAASNGSNSLLRLGAGDGT